MSNLYRMCSVAPIPLNMVKSTIQKQPILFVFFSLLFFSINTLFSKVPAKILFS